MSGSPDIPSPRPPRPVEAPPLSENYSLQDVVRIGIQSSRKITESFGKIRTLDKKSERQVVTEVDTAVEKELQEELKKLDPSAQFFGEEGGGQIVKTGDQWVVDPLDGTENMSGYPFEVGLSIGLIRNGEPVLGVIVDPLHKRAYAAQKDGGIHLIEFNDDGSIKERREIAVSECTQLENTAKVELGVSSKESSRRRAAEDFNFLNLDAKVQSVKTTGSPVLALGAVSEGSLDLLVREATKAPDLIAGVVMVREAGGKVVNYNGEEWTVDDIGEGKGIIAGSEKVVDEFISRRKEMKRSQAGRPEERKMSDIEHDERAFSMLSVVPDLLKAKAEGKKIVITNGHFSFLHEGHLHSFEQARTVSGDSDENTVLVVLVNNDEQTLTSKGKEKAAQSARTRATMVYNSQMVDRVIISEAASGDTAVSSDIQKLIDAGVVDENTTYVKGGDYDMGKNIPVEASLIAQAGGKFILVDRVGNYSTSNVIAQMGKSS